MDWRLDWSRIKTLMIPAAGAALLASALPAQASDDAMASWETARDVAGVRVEARPTDSGFDEHRAETAVCTDLASLEQFVADTSQFAEWVPFTRSARLLTSSADDYVYYVRSTTPWPLQDRDMVYRITRMPRSEEGLRLRVTGLPDYQPPNRNVARLVAAEGLWLLQPAADGINVRYQLYVDPGRVPQSAANRRLATVVGRTLANLSARFPCTAS